MIHRSLGFQKLEFFQIWNFAKSLSSLRSAFQDLDSETDQRSFVNPGSEILTSAVKDMNSQGKGGKMMEQV